MPKQDLGAKHEIEVRDNLEHANMATRPIPRIPIQSKQLQPIYLEYYAKSRKPTVGVSSIFMS
jgi:hypothetical protein